MLDFLHELSKTLQEYAKEKGVEIGIEEARNSLAWEHGKTFDISCSFPLKFSKMVNRSKEDVAEEIGKEFSKKPFVRNAISANGYVDIEINERYLFEGLGEIIENGIKIDLGKRKKVMVEFPSVNPTKPWHVGHLRNAIIGECISRLLETCNYRVERENYIDDLGLQVAEMIWGVRNIGVEEGKYDLSLGKLYAKVSSMLEKDERAKEEVNEILKKLEEGNNEISSLAREISEKCLMAQMKTAINYGIWSDVAIWESDVVRKEFLKKAMKIGEEKGVISTADEGKHKGCLVMKIAEAKEKIKELREIEGDEKVLVRSNGVATYLAKDIAFHMWKLGMINEQFDYKLFMKNDSKEMYSSSPSGEKMDFGNADITINIIDSSQSQEQASVKGFFLLIGEEEKARGIIHLGYGKVRLKEGNISGRRGNWIGEERNYTADDLFDYAKAKIIEISNSEPVAERMACAAIKFEYLRFSPEKEVVFDWERALNINANSGPYCLYCYARASKIVEKAGISALEGNWEAERGESFDLAKRIYESKEVVEKACRELRPNLIIEHTIKMCEEFNRFYEKKKVIAKEGINIARLALVMAFRETLKYLLNIIGVEPLENV
ncbi:MAG: arginine--tRNA ligase [Candidatus Micrarchaeaceae archaeon]